MRLWALVLALLPVPLAAAPDRKIDTPLLLNSSNLDPALLLPPPPPTASPAGQEELHQLHDIEAHRSADDAQRADAEGRTKDASIFAETLGPKFDLEHLPATKALFAIVRREEKAAAVTAKAHFKRDRPWVADPTLLSCSKKDEPGSSYPSGHASMAYSMAAVLARLAPGHAEAILLRAQRYVRSRLVCEVHYSSDVVAGQVFGMMIAERLMEQPSFQAQFAAAAAEMHQAGLR